ncbi:hypothetical protein E4U54_006095 [Claviceps lovelessii]|nr:hypothetical protein E4U54_006095 [Claviceps lovelessii]
MGHKWKRHQSSPVADTGIDLLSTAFGLPSHWDIKRADRKFRERVVYQYEDDSDESVDSTLDSEPKDAYMSHETSPSNRSAAPGFRTTVVKSCRKRQQSRRHTTSPSNEKQRNVLRKARGDSLSVKGKIKQQNSTQSRSQSKERDKTPKSATSSGCGPRLVKPQSVPKTDTRSYATTPQLPTVLKPVGQFVDQNASIRPQVAPLEAHSVILPPIPHQPGNPGYRFTCHYVTPATNEKRRPIHSTPVPNPETHKLLGLQMHLNNVQERLSNEPGNSRLQKDRYDAQQELNKFLDVLVAEKSQKSLRNSTTVMDKDSASKGNFSLDDEIKENVAPNDESIEPETGSSLPPQQQADNMLHLAALRGAGPSITMRHHLCSGCGEVRSQEFHEKNPISATRSHKPILNYCSACREMRRNKNMMDRHHFCFGCGKVRSKVFQEKYKIEPGASLLPNYCGICTNQVRLMEDNNEASVIGAVIRGPSLEEDHKAGGVSARDPLSASSTGGNSSPRQTLQILKKSGKAKKMAELRLSNKSPVKSTVPPVSPAESSPFYPGRRLGSAQRRAQRGSTPHPGEEHVAAFESLRGNHEYRVPYVEELTSETEPSEAVFRAANMETLNGGGAQSSCLGETSSEENFEANFAINAQKLASQETARRSLGTYEVASDGSSVSSEEQTSKPRHQYREVGRCDGLGFRSEQSGSTFSQSEPDVEQGYAHSTGVFGQGNKQFGEARFAEETDETTSRRRSPLAEFESPRYPSYVHEDHIRSNFQQDYPLHDQPGTNQFSSSRGAFGRKESYFSMFNYNSAGSGHSGSTNSLGLEGSNGPRTPRRSHFPGQVDGKSKSSSSDQDNSGHSSFSSSSSSGKPNSNNDQPAMKSTYSRSVFTDFSRSTNNPYYHPRRRQYPSCSEDAFHGSWNWEKRNQPPTMSKANQSTSFDERIPEPIVEEPVSAPSTPVPRTKLLEFKTPDTLDLDLPPELRDNGPSHNDMDGNGPSVPAKRTVLR